MEKTTLMQIGSTDPIPDDISGMGFDLQGEVKLLGLKLKNNGNYDTSIDDIEQSILYYVKLGFGHVLV